MSTIERDVLEAPTGYSSREVALFVAQMDDQSRRLRHDLEGITPAELAWQPAVGMNTIGMLLAHIAIVEVFWTQVGVRGDSEYDSRPMLGIGVDDDGMPLPPDGQPPAGLANKSLSFYLDLLDRARAYSKHVAASLADPNLDAMHSRTRRDGRMEEFNVRWVLYHMLEHLAGHYGQILLLRHQYRTARK